MALWDMYECMYCYNQCSKLAAKCRYTMPEVLFIFEFHTGTCQYIIIISCATTLVGSWLPVEVSSIFPYLVLLSSSY
jgi:hypothetical protein